MRILSYLPRFQRARRRLAEIDTMLRWSREELEAYQLEHINRIWSDAAGDTPYLHALKAAGNLPDRFRTISEFREKMPILDKHLVQQQPDQFVANRRDAGGWYRTGGSTGIPTRVYWGADAYRRSLCGRYHCEAMWGVDIFDRHVFLWGHAGSFAPGLLGGCQWVRQEIEDRLRNRMRLSAYCLGENDLRGYLRKMQSWRAQAIYGYSTAVMLLARQASRDQIEIPSLKLNVVTGETAGTALIDSVTGGLHAPTMIEYGSMECGVIANQFPDGVIRIREDVAMVETEPRPDGLYNVIVTMLHNRSFPLLRYRIHDVTNTPVTYADHGYSTMPMVAGRASELLVRKDGLPVHSSAVKAIFEPISEVRSFRANQSADGDVEVSVEMNSPLSASEQSRACAELCELLGGYDVRMIEVDSIENSLAGKHRWLHSELLKQRIDTDSSDDRRQQLSL